MARRRWIVCWLALLLLGASSVGCASPAIGGRGPQVYATPAEYGGSVRKAAEVAASEAAAGEAVEAAAEAGVDAAVDAYESGEFRTQLPAGLAGSLPWYARLALGLMGFVGDNPESVGGTALAALWLARSRESRRKIVDAVRDLNPLDEGYVDVHGALAKLGTAALPGRAAQPAPTTGPGAPS